jgi:hypothetical protein
LGVPERPLWEQYSQQLDMLRDLPINFDLERRAEFTKESGWHIDSYFAELPPEPPGPPVPGGPWEVACRLMREYRFPDPSILTGIFYPDRPLSERVMLLQARWLFFTFSFGVRVGGVTDGEVESKEGGRERVFSFNYQTLQGHMERGQMDFTAAKDLGSGTVSFRINAFSQSGQIRNPIVRLGFRLFGRRLQVRFARRSLRRMQELVRAELAGVRPDTPKAETTPDVGTVPPEKLADKANSLEVGVAPHAPPLGDQGPPDAGAAPHHR